MIFFFFFCLISNIILQMLIPLILQDKLSLAESFVKGHSQLEKQLVMLLDSWCHPDFSVEDIRKWAVCVDFYDLTVYCALSGTNGKSF